MSGWTPVAATPPAKKRRRKARGGGGVALGEVPPPDAVDRELAALVRNDSGNARRLIARFGRDLLWIEEIGWLFWTGSHWSDRGGNRGAQQRAQETATAIFSEARALQEAGPREGESAESFDDRVAVHAGWALMSGNTMRLSAMLEEAKPHLRREVDDLDRDPDLFNVQNGTIVFKRDGSFSLRPHERAHLISKISPVSFDPLAACPDFTEAMLEWQPDDDGEIDGFLRRSAGYALTGHTSEQVVLLFHGLGRNGKSTLIKILTWIMGDYAMTLPFASLLEDNRRRGGEATPDLARLPGRRLVVASEPPLNSKLDDSLIKSLTGGDAMAVRHLNRDMFEFVPVAKFILSFNIAPTVRGQDFGIWRRLLMVPWPVRIAKPDPTIDDRLKAEAAGILNWALRGYREWRQGKGLAPPAMVTDATSSFRGDQDVVGRFLDAATRPVTGARIAANALYEAYARWARASGLDALSGTMFGRLLTQRGVHKSKSGVVVYEDIELVEEFRPAQQSTEGSG